MAKLLPAGVSSFSVLALQLLAAHAAGIPASDAWLRARLIAITYEGLLVIPLVLLSGVFGLPENQLAVAVSAVLPTTGLVKYLLGVERDAIPLLISTVSTLAWFALAGV